MLQDLRFTFRLIAKERWYSAVAVIALALGIGANATVFTISSAVLFRGLPFKDSGRLYMLAGQPRQGGRAGVSYAEFQDWRSGSRTFRLAAFNNAPINISDDAAAPEQVRGTWVSANAFSLLGQQPLLGRDFRPEEDGKGAPPVAILGYRLWKSRYGGDPTVLGRRIRLNGQPATIVGVMPDGMYFPVNAEMWAPFIPTAAQEKRDARVLSVFGRLQQDATLASAQTELNGIAQRLAAAYPDTNKDLPGVRIETFTERFVGGNARVVFTVMLGAVGFVLLIACANVASLLLSRSAHRAREMAVRMAMGATRTRVLRQLLVESVVLGFIGGAIGLLIAVAAVPAFDAAVTDSGKPYWITFEIDYLVVAYVAAICLVTGVLFGLAPALHVSRTNMHEVLKEGGRGAAGGRRMRWLSGTMVVVELALTIVLLAGAGLMLRSFMNLYRLDVGIDTDRLMAMRLQLPAFKYATPDARRAFYERVEPRLRTIPGVEGIAVTTAVPPFGAGVVPIEIDGRPPRKPEEQPLNVSWVTIGTDFFTVAGVRVRGRAFTEVDGLPGAETVVINEKAASQYFPNENPLGQRIRFVWRQSTAGNPPPPWRTIVGVSPTIRHGAFEDGELQPVVYVPYRLDPPVFASLMIRSALPPGSVMAAVRREVQAIDPDQPVFTIQTVDQMMAENRWPFRVFGTLFAVFALVALVLSAVGLYSVMAYSVTQRTQEIGVRMALGAASPQVSWLILKRGMGQVAIGLTLGLAGAFGLTRVLGRLLIQVTPTDPATFIAIATLLILVSAAACLLPARRASRVDPLVALRVE